MKQITQIFIDGPDQLLFQWDRGQRIRIQGHESGTRVDFARYGQDNAVSMYAYEENDSVYCTIPDELLTEANHLRGFLYEIDGDKGETVHCFLLPVIPRPKPEDYVAPEEVMLWHRLEDRISGLEQMGFSASVSDRSRRPGRLMVSFIDDDCRAEILHRANENVPSLWEVIYDEEHGLRIPYTLACPPGNIGDEGFLSPDDLKKMTACGVTISNHAWRQYNMDDSVLYPDFGTFHGDLARCQEQFTKWGIPVRTMSYPQGRYVDSYIPAVKQFYQMGFTVNPGINQIPYASYYMDRVGLFSNNADDDGTAYLNSAIQWVNRLSEMESGWLIFMTHGWYAGFRPELLSDLIDYIQSDEIRSKGIEIVDIHEALATTGNVVEAGRVKKPLNEQAWPFFVVDADGKVHTNALEQYTRINYELKELQYGWRTGNCYLHGERGTVLNHDTDTNRRVSVDIPVNPGEVYRLNCSSVWSGAAFAVMTQAGGTAVAIYSGDADTPSTVLTNHELTIPEGGTILRVSSNLEVQPEGYKIWRVEYIEAVI